MIPRSPRAASSTFQQLRFAPSRSASIGTQIPRPRTAIRSQQRNSTHCGRKITPIRSHTRRHKEKAYMCKTPISLSLRALPFVCGALVAAAASTAVAADKAGPSALSYPTADAALGEVLYPNEEGIARELA